MRSKRPGARYATLEEDQEKIRAVARGGRKTVPFLKKYRRELGKVVLELGPYFSPSIVPKDFDGTIIYVDVNRPALEFLTRKYGRATQVIRFDLDRCLEGGKNRLREKLAPVFRQLELSEVAVDTVILSQVANYVDFDRLLRALNGVMAPNALLFINNGMNRGKSEFFHPKRPKSGIELLRMLSRREFVQVEGRILDERPSKVRDKPGYGDDPEIPPKVRVMMVLRKGGPLAR